MYVGVPLATLLYVVLDVYGVIGSFAALLRSVSFWLLWLLFTILNSVSFVILRHASGKFGGQTLSEPSSSLLLLFFSTVGTFSVIQSYSLRFGDYKAIDLEQFFANLRAGLLSEAASKKADLARARKVKLGGMLASFYERHPSLIDNDYDRLMMSISRTQAQITDEINAANLNPRGKISALVNTMVSADESTARTFYRYVPRPK